MKTPKPKPVSVVCDQCGLDWELHKPDAKGKVSLDECVRLLKIELSKPKPVTIPFVPYVPQPLPVTPWPSVPWPRPYVTWSTTTSVAAQSAAGSSSLRPLNTTGGVYH